ncbi:hypothetical protein RFI_19008 [Reticulomyxa filosa]|uniref:Uncharacterized protein n=1 Tax=Reticulomyxa filosa TaxID=46433 RepID=X6MWQ2_RETFI|nr:hypothetical protein RFI_19008 [Reticulomyxa filosa]|eukprot:ETO18269.1 hypothetical protein RFI_19008 [Reticulomyxa filosa]
MTSNYNNPAYSLLPGNERVKEQKLTSQKIETWADIPVDLSADGFSDFRKLNVDYQQARQNNAARNRFLGSDVSNIPIESGNESLLSRLFTFMSSDNLGTVNKGVASSKQAEDLSMIIPRSRANSGDMSVYETTSIANTTAPTLNRRQEIDDAEDNNDSEDEYYQDEENKFDNKHGSRRTILRKN